MDMKMEEKEFQCSKREKEDDKDGIFFSIPYLGNEDESLF